MYDLEYKMIGHANSASKVAIEPDLSRNAPQTLDCWLGSIKQCCVRAGDCVGGV